MDRWTDIIRMLDAMDEAYTNQVAKPFDAAGWTSFDGTSEFARMRVHSANKEFSDAVKEAKGIRAVLRDAYDELKKYKDDLIQLADVDARKDGVVISPTGGISLRDPSEEGSRGRGPGGMLPSENEAKVLFWEARINVLLVAAANADQSAAIALRRNAGDKDEGFNGKTATSVDQDESQRAAKLLKKYESGEKLSPAELKELDRVMSHNQKDPEFSRMVLNDLGPEGTLRLAEDLERERGGDNAGKDKYSNIQSALANNIATANKDKTFSEQWRKDMARYGTERPEDDGSKPYGYQTLTTLLKHGDTSSYPPHMTMGLTDDIIAAEKKSPGIWNEFGQANAGADVDPVAVKDPVDDMLKVMSGDPDTATRYLDPAGGNKNLEYLLDKRDWPDLEVREVARGMEPTGNTDHIDATNTRMGLGSALEAAVTGDKAGPPHTDAQARVMRDTINLLDGPPGHEEIPANLRKPMGNALADYTNDTHEILAGVNPDYRAEVAGEKGSKEGADGLFQKDGGTHIAPDPHKLIHVMRGVSEDPEAYGTMHKAEIGHISQLMGPSEGGTADSIEVPARDGAAALGAYDAIRYDVINDKRDDANAQEDWKAKTIYHVGGAPITGVPIIGDTAQRMLDTWTYDMSNQAKGENDDKAAAEVADKSLKSERELMFLIDTWADEKEGGPGVHDRDVDRLRRSMLNDNNTRHDKANEALGN